jgi:hypothetical protein
MRGRLIFAFLAELYRLDTKALATEDPDGAGPLVSGYDPDFKEPVLVDTNDDGLGERIRKEHSPVRVPCQVEPDSFEVLQEYASGNSPRSRIRLVFHFADLERMALVDSASGDALIRVGDRLGGLYDRSDVLVQAFRSFLFVTEARPIGFGLFMPRPRRNLLLVTFDGRAAASPRGVSG